MLCLKCSDLFAGNSEAPAAGPQLIHHHDLISLRSSMLADCHLCRLIADRFEFDTNTDGSQDAYNARHTVRWRIGNQGRRIYFSLQKNDEMDQAVAVILRAASFDLIPESGRHTPA
jgi:hypothetical protein